jgi:hypothetical protein
LRVGSGTGVSAAIGVSVGSTVGRGGRVGPGVSVAPGAGVRVGGSAVGVSAASLIAWAVGARLDEIDRSSSAMPIISNEFVVKGRFTAELLLGNKNNRLAYYSSSMLASGRNSGCDAAAGSDVALAGPYSLIVPLISNSGSPGIGNTSLFVGRHVSSKRPWCERRRRSPVDAHKALPSGMGRSQWYVDQRF